MLIARGVEVSGGGTVKVGRGVRLDRDTWLHAEPDAVLEIGQGSAIGRRSFITAAGYVSLGRDVLLGPDVVIVDNSHGSPSEDQAFIHQPVIVRGAIRVEDGCWLGAGVKVISGSQDLVIGRGSVVGAGTIVRGSVNPGSVVPAGSVVTYVGE